jgi:hypothetical protein
MVGNERMLPTLKGLPYKAVFIFFLSPNFLEDQVTQD